MEVMWVLVRREVIKLREVTQQLVTAIPTHTNTHTHTQISSSCAKTHMR